MRTADMVAKVIKGEDVRIISFTDGDVHTITGQVVEGKGLVLFCDGQRQTLHVIEEWHGRSPLFDPKAKDLNDWYFEPDDMEA